MFFVFCSTMVKALCLFVHSKTGLAVCVCVNFCAETVGVCVQPIEAATQGARGARVGREKQRRPSKRHDALSTLVSTPTAHFLWRP